MDRTRPGASAAMQRNDAPRTVPAGAKSLDRKLRADGACTTSEDDQLAQERS